MTAQKSCKYSEYGLFEHSLFLKCLCNVAYFLLSFIRILTLLKKSVNSKCFVSVPGDEVLESAEDFFQRVSPVYCVDASYNGR